MAASVTDIPVRRITGQPTTLGEYSGKVVLIVNVASKCGLTPQYEGLEKLYKTYQNRGLVVAGFPANEFDAQEPGSNTEILEFCTSNYGVQFPMFEKIVVKGEGQHPLYQRLTALQPKAVQKPGGTLEKALKEYGLLSGGPSEIMWNFEKFLVSRKGEVVARFSPELTPDDPIVVKAIEAELEK
jgi:glutathione peroxidase